MSEENVRDHQVPDNAVRVGGGVNGWQTTASSLDTVVHPDGQAPHEGDPTDVEGLQQLVAQLRGECAALRAEVAQFREAMTTRGVIEQAKGILGWQSHHDPEEMFGVLASVSQASNLKVRAVAELVVERATRGEEVPLDVLRRALIDAARRSGSEVTRAAQGESAS